MRNLTDLAKMEANLKQSDIMVMGPGSHGVMDKAVTCKARDPGFDPSFVQVVFSLRSKEVG